MGSSIFTPTDFLVETTSDYHHILFWTTLCVLSLVFAYCKYWQVKDFRKTLTQNLLALKTIKLPIKSIRPNQIQTLIDYLKKKQTNNTMLTANRLPTFLYNLYKKFWR